MPEIPIHQPVQASIYIPAVGKVTIFMLLRNLYVNFIVVIKFLLIETAVQIALTAIPTSIRVLSRIIEAVKSMLSYRTQINIMAKGKFAFPFKYLY